MGLLRAIFALAIVLGLILVLAWVLKRYAPQLMAQFQAQRGQRRMRVVETLVLDPARRLVLVSLDDEERLILLGEGHELIEPRAHQEAARTPAQKTLAAIEDTPSVPAQRPAPRTQAAAPQRPERPKIVLAPNPRSPAPTRSPQAKSQDPNDDLF